MLVGPGAARRDERLVESLHSFNDWIQLTGELGQAFFGEIREAETPRPRASRNRRPWPQTNIH